MHDQCLVRVLGDINGQTNDRQILLPKTFQGDIFNLCHEIPVTGHFGIPKTLEKIRKKFYWSAMTDDVTLWVRQCDQCAARKGPPKIRRAPLQLYQVGNPWDRIALDILTNLSLTSKQHSSIFVVQDYLTKWPEVFPLSSYDSVTVAEIIVNEIFTRFGAPHDIHSDQGSNFMSETFRHVCKLFGIKQTRIFAFHPMRRNGREE